VGKLDSLPFILPNKIWQNTHPKQKSYKKLQKIQGIENGGDLLIKINH